MPGRLRPGRSAGRRARGARARSRGRRPRRPARRGLPLRSARSRTVVPAGVWTSAFPASARAICCTRSSSASAHASSSASTDQDVCPDASASATQLLGRRRGRPRPARPPRARSGSGRRPSARDRAGRWRASSAGRPAPGSSRGTRAACVSSSSSSASSSRNPASENSGVRSSCEALATNSFRALSSCASWIRIRSNEAASWPSSSAPSSTTGSSNAPSAIRSAARWRRPIRRAWIAATAKPEDERDQQGGHGRVQEAPLDERDRRELIGERARQQHHVARREERHGHLRVLASLVADPGPNGPRPFARPRAPSSPSRSRCRRPQTSRRARAAPGRGAIPRRRRRRPASSRRTRRRRRNRPVEADSVPPGSA